MKLGETMRTGGGGGGSSALSERSAAVWPPLQSNLFDVCDLIGRAPGEDYAYDRLL